VHWGNSNTSSTAAIINTRIADTASCFSNPGNGTDNGARALGGGGNITVNGAVASSDDGKVQLVQTEPNPVTAGGTPTGWQAEAANNVQLNLGESFTIRAFVVCTK
jgi:hypothetical protein